MPPAGKNQNREQIARAETDARLAEPGWHVQDRNSIDFTVGQRSAVGAIAGIAVCPRLPGRWRGAVTRAKFPVMAVHRQLRQT